MKIKISPKQLPNKTLFKESKMCLREIFLLLSNSTRYQRGFKLFDNQVIELIRHRNAAKSIGSRFSCIFAHCNAIYQKKTRSARGKWLMASSLAWKILPDSWFRISAWYKKLKFVQQCNSVISVEKTIWHELLRKDRKSRFISFDQMSTFLNSLK